MTSPRLTVGQFSAIVTGQDTPPWRLAVQPTKPPGTSVSLKTLITEMSAAEVIVFLQLRNPSIFNSPSGPISVNQQEYLFARTCLSRNDLTQMIASFATRGLSIVYISPDWKTVGVRGTMGSISQMGLAVLTGVAGGANSGPVNLILNGKVPIARPLAAGGLAKWGFWWIGQSWKAATAGDVAETAALAAGQTAAEAAAAGDAAAVLAVTSEALSIGAIASWIGGASFAATVIAAAPWVLLVGAVGLAAWSVSDYLLEDQAPPIKTPLNTPTTPVNIPSSPPGSPPPVITNPPTYGPEPPISPGELISSTALDANFVSLLPYPPGVTSDSDNGSLLALNPPPGMIVNPWGSGYGNQIVAAGSTPGAGTGHATGPATGPVTGPVTGTETGPVTGTETGPVTGTETGPVTGTETGPDTGTETGPDTGDLGVALRRGTGTGSGLKAKGPQK